MLHNDFSGPFVDPKYTFDVILVKNMFSCLDARADYSHTDIFHLTLEPAASEALQWPERVSNNG